MARPYLGGTSGGIKAVSADTTLAVADSGKTIVIDGSTALNLTMTLPATATSKGVILHFVLGVANHANTQVLVTSDTNIVGFLIDSDSGESAYATSGASRGFDDASKAGSQMNMVCDGSKWMILNASCDLPFITAIA